MCCNALQRAATRCKIRVVSIDYRINRVKIHTATYCNTLQRVVTRCNTLQHAATRCNIYAVSIDYLLSFLSRYRQRKRQRQNHTATHCNTLQHTATHCNTLQHTATHCNTLQHTATHCNALHNTAIHVVACVVLPHYLSHTATHCNMLQRTTAHCNTCSHNRRVNTLSATHSSTLQHNKDTDICVLLSRVRLRFFWKKQNMHCPWIICSGDGVVLARMAHI